MADPLSDLLPAELVAKLNEITRKGNFSSVEKNLLATRVPPQTEGVDESQGSSGDVSFETNDSDRSGSTDVTGLPGYRQGTSLATPRESGEEAIVGEKLLLEFVDGGLYNVVKHADDVKDDYAAARQHWADDESSNPTPTSSLVPLNADSPPLHVPQPSPVRDLHTAGMDAVLRFMPKFQIEERESGDRGAVVPTPSPATAPDLSIDISLPVGDSADLEQQLDEAAIIPSNLSSLDASEGRLSPDGSPPAQLQDGVATASMPTATTPAVMTTTPAASAVVTSTTAASTLAPATTTPAAAFVATTPAASAVVTSTTAASTLAPAPTTPAVMVVTPAPAASRPAALTPGTTTAFPYATAPASATTASKPAPTDNPSAAAASGFHGPSAGVASPPGRVAEQVKYEDASNVALGKSKDDNITTSLLSTDSMTDATTPLDNEHPNLASRPPRCGCYFMPNPPPKARQLQRREDFLAPGGESAHLADHLLDAFYSVDFDDVVANRNPFDWFTPRGARRLNIHDDESSVLIEFRLGKDGFQSEESTVKQFDEKVNGLKIVWADRRLFSSHQKRRTARLEIVVKTAVVAGLKNLLAGTPLSVVESRGYVSDLGQAIDDPDKVV